MVSSSCARMLWMLLLTALPGVPPAAAAGAKKKCFFKDSTWQSEHMLKVSINVTDPYDCRSVCESTSGCKAFTLHQSPREVISNICVLFSSTANDLTTCEYCISGDLASKEGCASSLKGGCANTGDNYIDSVYSPSEEDCLKKCRSKNGCEWYTWTSSDSPTIENLCMMFSTCDSMTKCTDCLMGSRQGTGEYAVFIGYEYNEDPILEDTIETWSEDPNSQKKINFAQIPEPFAWPTAITRLGSQIIACGGMVAHDRENGDYLGMWEACYSMSIDNPQKWTRIADMKRNRGYHSLTTVGSHVIAMGGDSDDDHNDYQTFEIFDGKTWKLSTLELWPVKNLTFYCTLPASDTEIWVVGGMDSDSDEYTQQIQKYNIHTGQIVEKHLAYMPEGNSSKLCARDDKFIYTGEDINDDFLKNVWRYDIANDSWEELPAAKIENPSELMVLNGRLYAIGESSVNVFIEDEGWVAVSPPPKFSPPRNRHVVFGI